MVLELAFQYLYDLDKYKIIKIQSLEQDKRYRDKNK